MRASKRDTKSSLQVHRKKGNVFIKNLPQVNDFTAQRDRLQRTPYVTSPSESEGSIEKKRHHIEKSVIDSYTPELVAFYQRYNYEFVKDIFMDTEVPSLNRCSVENCELDHKYIRCMLNSDVDSNNESTSETLKTVSCNSNDRNKDVIKRCGSVNLVMELEADSDAIGERLTTFSIEKIAPERQLVREVTGREADLANYMESSAADAIHDNSHTSESLSKSEMESGNIIYHSDSSITTIDSNAEFKQNVDFQQLVETASTFRPHMVESLISSSESIVHQNDQGEYDSFSVGSLSCRTTYSGQIPYAESISIQSNSSTTSSRSFAFPILPSEWNGSPVRMVKPDRRQLIKQRNWKMCFLCCQF